MGRCGDYITTHSCLEYRPSSISSSAMATSSVAYKQRERDIIGPAVSYVDWSGETDGLRSTQPKKTANIHSSRPAR